MLIRHLKIWKRWPIGLVVLTVIGVNCLGIGSALPDDAPAKVAVLISQNIRPYIEAADGAVDVLEKERADVDAFMLDQYAERDIASLRRLVTGDAYDLFLSVGPQASEFFWSLMQDKDHAVVYTMVLDPEKILDAPSPACGISLSIPLEVQLQAISQTLPSQKRIGLMYDPKNNAAFYDMAERLSAGAGLSIVPIKVSDRKEIAHALTGSLGKIDGLWLIPDRTIISESIVRYIIKQALLNNLPVIGYNRFFYESGAAMSFIFDYTEIGEQTGRLALKMLASRQCETDSPVFQTWINERVFKKLGIPSNTGGSSRMDSSVTVK